MLIKTNARGQSSFELILVVAIIIILSMFVLVNGIGNLNEVSALAYTHNAINKEIIKQNYTGIIKEIKSDAGENTIYLEISTTVPIAINTEELAKNIKNKTKFEEIDIKN